MLSAVDATLPTAVLTGRRRRSLPARAVPTLATGLGLGVAVEVLFDGHALGLSVPLFLALCLGALGALGGRDLRVGARPQAPLLVVPLFFAAMVAVRASPVLTALNLAVGGGCLLVLLDPQGRRGLGAQTLRGVGQAAARSVWGALADGPAVVWASAQQAREARAVGRIGPVLRGLVFAVPILAIFTVLLASADAVFGERVSAAVVAFSSWGWVERAAVIGVATVLCSGLCAHALRSSRVVTPEGEVRQAVEVAARPRLGFAEALTVLVCLNVLFAAFVAVQAAYLFGGPERLAAIGIGYADYARHGFFELQAVAVLTLALVMALGELCARSPGRQTQAFNLACTALVLLVFAIVGSAHKRLGLYEEAFGYTELRVYSHAFIFLVAAVLGWRVLTFWRLPRRFTPGMLALGAVALAALDLLNPDAFIARHDLARARPDAEYLAALSDDAVPTIARAAKGQSPVASSLLETFARRDRDPSWPALHLAHVRAGWWLPACEAH